MSSEDATALDPPRLQRPELPEAIELNQAMRHVEAALFGTSVQPVCLGRYALLERLGQGGSGVVYAAYDPELDRKVAIKLFHTQGAGATGQSEARARLQREGQAIAQLSHPNVVTIHDVSAYDVSDTLQGAPWDLPAKGVFIVMEFVRGGSLARWLQEQRRPWRDVVGLFLQAGRGLEAAHAARIVHRDFKPHNVLVGDDGVARVVDFGIARSQPGDPPRRAPATAAAEKPSAHRPPTAGSTLSESGAIVGTPAYMSPEQHAGGDVDERSDQYSFCLSLWEALYGSRPFAGPSLLAFEEQKRAADVRPPASADEVPAWLHRVVVRGLDPEPARRFVSMRALLAALDRRRSRQVRHVAGFAALAAVSGAVLVAGRGRDGEPACAAQADRLAGIWDAQRKAEIAAAFVATGKPYAADAWSSVERTLDNYATRWIELRTEACQEISRATHAPDALERRMICLERRLQALAESTRIFTERTVEHAPEIAAGLPSPDRCFTATEGPPTDATERADVQRLSARLARGEALLGSTELDQAATIAAAATAEAAALRHGASEARAQLLLGNVRFAQQEADAASEAFFRAFLAATRAAAPNAIVGGLLGRARVQRVLRARHDEAELLARHARFEATEYGVGALLEANVLTELGEVHYARGEHDEALEQFEAALTAQEHILGSDHPTVAATLHAMGRASYKKRDFDSALRLHRRALAAWEAVVGRQHPALSDVLGGLGNVAWRQGDYETALAYHRRALQIDTDALGPDRREVAVRLLSIGSVLGEMGRTDEALDHRRRALALSERVLGPDHPLTAKCRNNVGGLLVRLGQIDEGLQHLRRALEASERVLGPEHPDLAYPLLNIGSALYQRGDLEQALPLLDRARSVWAAALGSDHPKLILVLRERGLVLADLGRREAAIESLNAALAIHAGHEGDPLERARTRFALARVLWPGDRPRARQLATQAHEVFQQSQHAASERAEADTWLVAHGT